MIHNAGRRRRPLFFFVLALALGAGAGSLSAVSARAAETPQQFWHIPVWTLPGAWQDSTLLFPGRCPGGFHGPPADSLRNRPRTLTVRFLRSRRVEARPDFGGYRVYRVTGTSDTASMMLIRRFSVNPGDEVLWNFSRVDTTTLEFRCGLRAAYDSVVTFVDPDSNGALVKVCVRVDHLGRCLSIGDSVWKFQSPPGPHDGFRTWYTVTYEAFNTLDNTFEDLFVPDTSDAWARCGEPGVPGTCPNLNHKAANVTALPVVPSAAPAADLEGVHVVPNPFRAHEAWDQVDGNMVQFLNLPDQSRIRIYTLAGELVRELRHQARAPQPLLGGGNCLNCESWDLKNASGNDVASGIYLFRVDAGSFVAQNRLIVIR